ncbi:MAG: hypothetical protein NUV56_01175 [Candidatus Uhrbacteria bacterium]|nr:hypothetical protein [Candidatus Uhrbacteria bacterium]
MQPRGSIMLEALIAAGVAAMFMTAIVSLVVISNQTSDRASELQLATWNVNEGLEALQTIAFADLANTESGALTMAGARWTVTAGPQALSGGMSRTLRVRDVRRDASCFVVASGGTIDPDSKYLISEMTWSDTAGRSHTSTQEMLRTRWDDPQGTCFAAQQASQVSFVFSDAQFSGGKQLRNVFMTNTGGTAAVIDRVTFTWDYPTTLSQLFIDTSKVWSSSGPGTPSGLQTSVATLDVEDFTIEAGATVELNKGQFADAMTGATISISVIYGDGSVYSSPYFQPN